MPPFYLYLAVQDENPFNAARMSAAGDGLTEPHIYFAPKGSKMKIEFCCPRRSLPLHKGRWAGDGSTGLQLTGETIPGSERGSIFPEDSG